MNYTPQDALLDFINKDGTYTEIDSDIEISMTVYEFPGEGPYKSVHIYMEAFNLMLSIPLEELESIIEKLKGENRNG